MQRGPVQDTAPLAITAAIEFIGVLEAEQCLGLAVACLLAEEGARALSAVVPNEGARREGDPAAGLLQPPADVHVIARFTILRVEAVDRLQGFAAEGHVA